MVERSEDTLTGKSAMLAAFAPFGEVVRNQGHFDSKMVMDICSYLVCGLMEEVDLNRKIIENTFAVVANDWAEAKKISLTLDHIVEDAKLR